MNITTATPVEIDTAIAAIYAERYRIEDALDRLRDDVLRAAGAKRTYGRGSSAYSMTMVDALQALRAGEHAHYGKASTEGILAKWDALQAKYAEQIEALQPYNDEYTRRGGWTRGFLVTDGHVHSSMACSTCRPTTQFTWLVDYSGRTEAEVIEAAADRACTVCYPNAPVVASGTSRLMTADERTRAEAREAAAKAKAERDAKKIAKGLTTDGSEFVVRYEWMGRTRTERFKTEQAATQWVVSDLVSPWGTDERAGAYRDIIDAIAAKHGISAQDVVDTILRPKAIAKAKRDGYDGYVFSYAL